MGPLLPFEFCVLDHIFIISIIIIIIVVVMMIIIGIIISLS